MPRLSISTKLVSPPEQVWEAIHSVALWNRLIAPLFSISVSSQTSEVHDVISPGEYLMDTKVFSGVSVGQQKITLSDAQDTNQTTGKSYYSASIEGQGIANITWYHTTLISENPDCSTQLRDILDYSASFWLSPLLWIGLLIFLFLRQRKWKALDAEKFRGFIKEQ